MVSSVHDSGIIFRGVEKIGVSFRPLPLAQLDVLCHRKSTKGNLKHMYKFGQPSDVLFSSLSDIDSKVKKLIKKHYVLLFNLLDLPELGFLIIYDGLSIKL